MVSMYRCGYSSYSYSLAVYHGVSQLRSDPGSIPGAATVLNVVVLRLVIFIVFGFSSRIFLDVPMLANPFSGSSKRRQLYRSAFQHSIYIRIYAVKKNDNASAVFNGIGSRCIQGKPQTLLTPHLPPPT